MKPTRVSTSVPAAADRESMIAGNMGLVHHIARRVGRNGAAGADLSDLVSGGTIGLIQAVDSFDASQRVTFSTYAAPRIRGAMLDDMRRCDHASRTSRRRHREIRKTEQALSSKLVRSPDHGEVAEELGVTTEALWEWKAGAASAVHVSLEDRITGRSTLEELAAEGADDLDAPLEKAEQMEWLRSRMADLDKRERQVLALYYARGLKLREIAEVLGVTESRVSQIRTAVLGRLRSEWQAEVGDE